MRTTVNDLQMRSVVHLSLHSVINIRAQVVHIMVPYFRVECHAVYIGRAYP